MGGGGKGGNTTTSTFQPPQAFMKAYKESLNMARDAVDNPYRRYRGDLVANLTPTQKSGIRNVNKAQGMALPAIKQGMQYTKQAARGVTPDLYKRFYSPYVKDVADTTFANLMESQAQQQSGLKSGAIQAGAFGGDRGGIAQAEMARQQQLGNAMAMSNIYNQGYGQAMGLAGQQVANRGAMGQQLAGLGAAAQGSVLQGAQAQMAAGAQQQATKQAELQAAYQQWMQKQAYPYQQAQFFANIAQGLGAGAGGTSSTTGPEPSLMSQILGGVGAVGSIASDKRVKENIEAVGTLNDGQTVYRYNFKGDPKTQIGLLAQEVEETKPGAVTQVKGLKMVDYKGATDDAAKMSSMGGVVGPAMNRQGLAGGGIPYYPYGDAISYVPEGKIGSSGDTIPGPVSASEEGGLAAGWGDITPISKEQASGLRALAADVGLDLPKSKAAEEYDEENMSDNLFRTGIKAVKEKFFPSPSLYASGGLVGRGHYQDGGMEDAPTNEGLASVPAPTPAAEPEFKYPTNEEVEAYIAQEAARRNIDPEVAVRVWQSEGASGDPREAWQSKVINKRGERERSYGPYQLYMEGGLGNEMVDKTGLSPEDPRNWKPSVEFALDQAATGGWSPWYGAKKVGVEDRAGLAGAKAIGSYAKPEAGLVVSPASSDSSGVAASAPPEPVTSGLVIEGEKPRSKFDLSKIFASEENPSLIERIMGRRLSPEARSAVMNASFALMAGRSPFFFTNLGEAGRVGTSTYYNAVREAEQSAERRRKLKKEEDAEIMLERAISQLPPEQQEIARISPEQFFKSKAESIFGTSDLPNLVEEYREAVKGGYTGTLEDWKKIDGANNGDLGLQLVPLIDRRGNFVGYGQASKAGGIYFQGEPIDGSDVRPMDPSLAAQSKAAGSAMGTQMGGAAVEIPAAQIDADAMNAAIDLIINDPNLGDAIGYGNVLGDYFVSNEVLRIRSNLEKLEGGAFLSAYTMLKGGGQITEMESDQAKKAIADMKTARKMSDKDMFIQSLNQLRDAFNRGVAKLRARAGQYAPQSEQPQTAPSEVPDVSEMTDEQLENILREDQNGQ